MSDYANLRVELQAAYDMIEDLEGQIPPPPLRTPDQAEAMVRREAKKHEHQREQREHRHAHEDAARARDKR